MAERIMRVKTKAGAACRAEAALDSPLVAQLMLVPTSM